MEPCDSLYVSPLPEVAARSCASRIAWERERGLKVLLLVLFGDSCGSLPVGVEGVACGLPDASARHAAYASLHARLSLKQPEDEDALCRAAALLDDLGRQSGARHVYAPLGVGEHIDHRLAHEAALRAFQASAGRNVFLYEEQPQAAVRGAVHLRLARLGSQLPPAALAAPRAGLLRFVLGFALAAQLRRESSGVGDWLACVAGAARHWRAARGWRPQRGLGPRLQPIDQDVSPSGSGRYWLLLPERVSAGAPLVSDERDLAAS